MYQGDSEEIGVCALACVFHFSVRSPARVSLLIVVCVVEGRRQYRREEGTRTVMKDNIKRRNEGRDEDKRKHG
jgi:hypothetical protein